MKTAAPLGLLPDRLAPEFEAWVCTCHDDADLAALLAVHESGEFGAQICAGNYRLSPAQRDAVREKAIHLIVVRDPPEYRVGRLAWRTDGKRLRVTLTI